MSDASLAMSVINKSGGQMLQEDFTASRHQQHQQPLTSEAASRPRANSSAMAAAVESEAEEDAGPAPPGNGELGGGGGAEIGKMTKYST